VHPANKMPFGRDTQVVPNNIVLYRVPIPDEKGRFGGLEPPVHGDAPNYFGPCSKKWQIFKANSVQCAGVALNNAL